MADVIVSTVKSIIENNLPTDVNFTLKWDRKESEVINYYIKVVEDVVNGSTAFKIVDYNTETIYEDHLLKDYSFTDYNTTYNVIDNVNGSITIDTPLETDMVEGRTFTLKKNSGNVVKVLEGNSTYNRREVKSRCSRVRVKSFDVVVSTENDSVGDVADNIVRWFGLLFSNEQYKCIDNIILYLDTPIEFFSASKDVNNRVMTGQIKFKIYETK